MKKIIILLLAATFFINVNAQSKQKYVDEAYCLIKVKSFNPNTNSKKCDVYAYLKAGNLSKQVTYFVELKRKGSNETIFRNALDFRDMSQTQGTVSYRQKDDVYELFYGLYVIHEDTYMQLIAIEPDGNQLVIPVEFTDYKNPITIMN